MKSKINTNLPILTTYIIAIISVLFFMIQSCEEDEIEPSPSEQSTRDVVIQNLNYSPATLTISINTLVTWRNNDNVNHTVTSDDGNFDSGIIGSNGTFGRRFTNAGTFPYHCTFHPGMKGTVVVQ